MAQLGDRNDDHYNSHGYRDPTAYHALKSIDEGENRFKKLLKTIFSLCELAGFEVKGRITLVDRRTGREWD